MQKISVRMVSILALLAWSSCAGLSAAWGDEAEDTQPAAEKTSSKSVSDRLKTLEKRMDSADQKFQQIREDQLRLHFNLYGDGEYRVYGAASNFPQQNGFYIGQTDLHIMAQYGPHLGAMVENVVEFDGQNPSIDLERVMVYYSFSDEFRLAAGRDHTAFGYWNRTFHHGSQFQTTIDRPFFLAFEDGGGSDQSFKKGGVVPNHIVGAFAYGTLGLGSASLKYELNVGNNGNITLNGDGAGNPTDMAINFNPSGGDNFNSKRLAARLVLKPDAGGGLAVGVASVLSHYTVVPTDPSLVLNPALPPSMFFTDLAQLLMEGEVIYTDENFELLSEFYLFDDAVGGGSTSGSAKNSAFYVQLAYQVASDIKPYVRVENLYVDGTDPFFQATLWSNRTVYLLGIKYDVVPAVSALKLEAHLINDSGTNYTELASAWSWGF